MANAVRAPEAPAKADGARLDSYTELATTRRKVGPCTCRSEWVKLRSEHGELVEPRRGLVNSCESCAMRKGYEDLEMLVADALEGDAPTVLVVTTTRTATLDMAAFRLGRQEVWRAIRRRWGAEYASKVEYTTGYGGPRPDGLRRPHWNWLIKGVPDDDVDDLRALVRRLWCRHVDALPEHQYCEQLRTPVAALKYIIEHFSKASQRPPAGFKGQRFNCSRGYFPGGVRPQRQRARETQALGLQRSAAEERGESPADAELTAQLVVRRQAQTRWTLTTASGARLGREPIGPELTERLRKARRAGPPPGDGRTEGRPVGPPGPPDGLPPHRAAVGPPAALS